MSNPVDENTGYVSMSPVDALKLYRTMIVSPKDLASFQGMSQEDRLELLYHSVAHLTGIVARLTGHIKATGGKH